MAKCVITEGQKNALSSFFQENPAPELVNTYLFFVQNKFDFKPVLCPKDKTIYQSASDAARLLSESGKLWNETEIKITFDSSSVNDQTKKVYICPFTGKVFGDNTHPNPQDAIYTWVSKCPENKERVGGLKVKRFYVSEDPEVIKNYAAQSKPKEPISKVVYSSQLSGKLFNTKEGVVEDFKKNYLKPISLIEAQNQNRYQIEESCLSFIQKHLAEDKITDFVEALSEYEEFSPIIEKWLE